MFCYVSKLDFAESSASCLPVRFCQWEAFARKWKMGGGKNNSPASVPDVPEASLTAVVTVVLVMGMG